mmetsp:Transcript_11915/g.17719  ORF Transcript_11915/g.17719 Transcript_11915/m.17719 type:complete len:234 (+) Transcript_11915:39-740(+)
MIKKCYSRIRMVSINQPTSFCSRTYRLTNYMATTTQKDLKGNVMIQGVRCYFFKVDGGGRLFLEDTKHKNFVSCFTDADFLQFFYTHVRPNTSSSNPYYDDSLTPSSTYPYVSVCQGEYNYIQCDVSTPFVAIEVSENEQGEDELVYAGGHLTIPFDPSSLTLDFDSARVYHPYERSKKWKKKYQHHQCCLSDVLTNKLPFEWVQDDQLVLHWKNQTYPVRISYANEESNERL